MKIEEAKTEEGYRMVYEKGDRVKIIHSDSWHIPVGQIGTISDGPSVEGGVALYEIQPNGTLNNWGHITVPVGYFQPHAVTRAKLPELIREWKQSQVRKLIGA